MRIPSYLVRNRFGTYYFRVVFPEEVYDIINKKETRRSLRTASKKVALQISLEFQNVTQKLFNEIVSKKMKYKDVKRILDVLADDLFEKYVKQVENVGFNFIDEHSLYNVSPTASTFLSPNPTIYQGQPVHMDQDTGHIIFADEFEASYHKQPAVVEFVDQLIKKHGLKIDRNGDQYKAFCRETLQMLLRLDRQKEAYRNQELYGAGNQPTEQVASKTKSSTKKITISQLADMYFEYKVMVEKEWSENTQKSKTEYLNRIKEIFEYVSGSKYTVITEYNKDTASEVRKVLSILPTNMKKKYPNLSFKQIVAGCKKGEIAPNKEDRFSITTYNTYATLINALFAYAKDEGLVQENFFNRLKVKNKDKGKKKRNPFTENEIKLFFSTDLYVNKKFELKHSWRYWVPIILMYSGARIEEICQLYLDDIEVNGQVKYFNICAKDDPKTDIKLTSVKNPQSQRIIPMHPVLIDIGLLEYINYLKGSNEIKLFPTLKNRNRKGKYKKAGHDVTRWFNEESATHYKKSYLSRCGIRNEDDKKSLKKVLYCFRHTVETILINHPEKIQLDEVDVLFGHQVEGTGRRHYGEYYLETLFDVVRKINYPPEILPWSSNTQYRNIPFPWE